MSHFNNDLSLSKRLGYWMRLERKSPQVVFILKYFLNMNVKLSAGVRVCVVSTKLEEKNIQVYCYLDVQNKRIGFEFYRNLTLLLWWSDEAKYWRWLSRSWAQERRGRSMVGRYTLKGRSKYDSVVSLHSSSSDMFRYIYTNLRKILVLRKLSKNIL